MLFSFTFVHKIYIFWLSPLELLASTLNKTKSRLVTNRKLKQEHENAMSPKTDERKFIPLHQVIKVFVSRSRGEISGWRGSRRSLGGLVFHRFPSCVFYVTWKIRRRTVTKYDREKSFSESFLPRRNCDCIVQLWRWNTTFPTNIININLVGNFSFQKFVYIIIIIIIKLICSNTNDISNKHEG